MLVKKKGGEKLRERMSESWDGVKERCENGYHACTRIKKKRASGGLLRRRINYPILER